MHDLSERTHRRHEGRASSHYRGQPWPYCFERSDWLNAGRLVEEDTYLDVASFTVQGSATASPNDTWVFNRGHVNMHRAVQPAELTILYTRPWTSCGCGATLSAVQMLSLLKSEARESKVEVNEQYACNYSVQHTHVSGKKRRLSSKSISLT